MSCLLYDNNEFRVCEMFWQRFPNFGLTPAQVLVDGFSWVVLSYAALWIQPAVTVSNRGLLQALNSASSENTLWFSTWIFLTQKSLFTLSFVQVSFHCDTEGPIETEIYLHCSVVCLSPCWTKSAHRLEWANHQGGRKEWWKKITGSYKEAYRI